MHSAATISAMIGIAADVIPAMASTSVTTPTPPATVPPTTNRYARRSRARRGV